MKINIIESTMVKPSKPTPSKILWNSNLDLLFKNHVLSVYFYKPTIITNNFFDSRIMKEALSNVLVSFYPMAGRLIWGKGSNGKGKRIETNCNGEGVLFVEAQSDDTCVDDFGDFIPNLEMRKLIPSVDTCDDDISSFPLVIFQVTRFKCGGVSLGTGISHILADGVSAIHFINAWSEIARGLSVIVVPPFIDRSLLCARDPPTPAFEHVEYHPLLTLKNVPNSTTLAMLKITSDQLTLLRTRCEHKGTTFQVLAAHIWRCVCKARGLDDDQLTKLKINTDGRTRLVPPLPQGFLGNVVFTALPFAKSGELQSEPLTKTVQRIHDAVTKMDDEYLRSAIDYLELTTDLSESILWPTFPIPNLKIISWTKMPIHDADFGWGKPIDMVPAIANWHEGTVYILSSPNDDKNLRLLLCLYSHHMPLFEKYLYDF